MIKTPPPLWSLSIKKLLDAFCRRPRGSVLITGPPESGRTTAVKYLVEQIRGNDQSLNPIEQLSGPSFKFNPQTIEAQFYRIESIQALVQRLSLSPPDPQQPYLVVIDDFDLIASASQNVLLKQIEEPGSQVSFLLTACEAPGKVLPTIASRCQPIQLRRPPKAEMLAWIKANWPEIDDDQTQQCYTKTDGWPAGVAKLLDQPEESSLNRRINQAKQFLAAEGPAGRLAVIHQLPGSENEQQKLANLITGLQQTSRGALISLAGRNKVVEAQSWQSRVIEFDRLRSLLESGSSPAVISLALSLFDQPRN